MGDLCPQLVPVGGAEEDGNPGGCMRHRLVGFEGEFSITRGTPASRDDDTFVGFKSSLPCGYIDVSSHVIDARANHVPLFHSLIRLITWRKPGDLSQGRLHTRV